MNLQVKEKWLNALWSGDYQQTQNRLHDENGFCCLGVLCDLYGKENNVEWNLANNGHNYYRFQGMVVALPLSVMGWAGVENHDPHVNTGTRTKSLVALNDTGFTFNEIANLIEKHL